MYWCICEFNRSRYGFWCCGSVVDEWEFENIEERGLDIYDWYEKREIFWYCFWFCVYKIMFYLMWVIFCIFCFVIFFSCMIRLYGEWRWSKRNEEKELSLIMFLFKFWKIINYCRWVLWMWVFVCSCFIVVLKYWRESWSYEICLGEYLVFGRGEEDDVYYWVIECVYYGKGSVGVLFCGFLGLFW